MTKTESRIASGPDKLTSRNDADALGNDERQKTEADLRELAAYTLASEDRTLVGLGPVERTRRSRAAAEIPDSQRMPPSEPPGPFIANDDDEELARSLRGRKLGPWAIAVPSVLVVAAAAVAVLRSVAPVQAPTAHSAVALVSEPNVARDQAPATAGLEVKVKGVAGHVLIDGVDHGPSPVLAQGLKPGSHVVSIADPAYALYSQPVLLTADSTTTLEPVLTFVRGTLLLNAAEGAEDAEVEVIGANERREIQHLPARLEVAAGEYQIRGTRKGYAPFESTAVLSATSPEVQVSIALVPRSSESTRPAMPLSERATGLAVAAEPSTPPNATLGSLNLSSSPPVNVVLDGRPIGKAPRFVQLPPGAHTVVFVHPQLGRQSRSVNVSPGHTTDASANF